MTDRPDSYALIVTEMTNWDCLSLDDVQNWADRIAALEASTPVYRGDCGACERSNGCEVGHCTLGRDITFASEPVDAPQADPAPPVAESVRRVLDWLDVAHRDGLHSGDTWSYYERAATLIRDHARIVQFHMAGAIEIQLLLDAKTLECESAQGALRDALADCTANHERAEQAEAALSAIRKRCEGASYCMGSDVHRMTIDALLATAERAGGGERGGG